MRDELLSRLIDLDGAHDKAGGSPMRGDPKQRKKIRRKRGHYFKDTFETGMEAAWKRRSFGGSPKKRSGGNGNETKNGLGKCEAAGRVTESSFPIRRAVPR